MQTTYCVRYLRYRRIDFLSKWLRSLCICHAQLFGMCQIYRFTGKERHFSRLSITNRAESVISRFALRGSDTGWRRSGARVPAARRWDKDRWAARNSCNIGRSCCLRLASLVGRGRRSDKDRLRGQHIRRLWRLDPFGRRGDGARSDRDQCRRRCDRQTVRGDLARFQDQARRGCQAGSRFDPDRKGRPSDRPLLEFGLHGDRPGLEAIWYSPDQRGQRQPQGDVRLRSPECVSDPTTRLDGKALAEYPARKGWNTIVKMVLDHEWGRGTVKVFTKTRETETRGEDFGAIVATHRRDRPYLLHYCGAGRRTGCDHRCDVRRPARHLRHCPARPRRPTRFAPSRSGPPRGRRRRHQGRRSPRHPSRRAGLPDRLRPSFDNYGKVLDYCRTLARHKPVEEFHLLLLDRKNVLLRDELHQTGTVSHTRPIPGRFASVASRPEPSP